MSEKNKGGRPSKLVLYGGHIRAAEDKVADRLGDFVDNLIELARGIWVEELLPDGVTRKVYKRPPDRQSNEYLMNRIMGKPTEIQEISGPDGEAIKYVDRAHNFRDKKAVSVNGNGHTNGSGT